MHPYAHNNTIYNSQDKEGNKMFTDRYMDTEDVIYIYIHTHIYIYIYTYTHNGILIIHKKTEILLFPAT